MAPKRVRPPPEEDEGEGSHPPKQRRYFPPEFTGNNMIARFLEQFLRRLIQDEAEKAISEYVDCLDKVPRQLHDQNECPRYQLQFQNKLNGPFYTLDRIEMKDRMLVQIAIIDKNLQKIVTSGTYSSVTVEIVVLCSDFGDDRDNWSSEEFNTHVVCEREGKPLLKGKLIIELVNGVADLDVVFTDNSSWRGSRKFRLGVRLSKRGVIRNGVQEGISESFRVKEYRGKVYEKHHPPSLTDEVWRLVYISKGGPYCEALKNNGITTVEDFLKSYTIDEAQLHRMFGKTSGKSISSKSWEALVEHAKKCDLGDKLYSYHNRDVMLFLNCIYQVVGAKFDGHYNPFDKLNSSQQALVEEWKKLAYQNRSSIQLDHKMIDNQPVPLDQVAMQVGQEQTANNGTLHDLSQEDILNWPDQTMTQCNSIGGEIFDDPFGRENVLFSGSLQHQITPDGGTIPESMTVDQYINWDIAEVDLLCPPEKLSNESSRHPPKDFFEGVQQEIGKLFASVSPRSCIKIMVLVKFVCIAKRLGSRRYVGATELPTLVPAM